MRADLVAVRAALEARIVKGTGGPGEVWRAISPDVRAALVMLSIDVYEFREFARRPWGSYSADDQVKLGAAARLFSRELAQAGMLR